MKARMRRMWRSRAARNAAKSPLEASTAIERQIAGERAIAAEAARIVPSETEIDDAAEITTTDIANAVAAWDDAQEAADTGLEGMLSARVDDDE
jgi:hypothetical protein